MAKLIPVTLDTFQIGAGTPVLIAGPCVIESRTLVLEVAERLKNLSEQFGLPLIFKSSYLKANRLSGLSFAGPGIDEGLKILEEVRNNFKLPVTTDVHSAEQAGIAGKVVDLIQIPAFLCRQTDIVVAAARTGRVINIKKGQFLAPEDMSAIVNKAVAAGNSGILLTERGTTFGYHNLVVDFRSLVIMRTLGFPVIYDATHSLQLPGASGSVGSRSSGGQREFALPLAKAALAVGVDGLFFETHPDPSRAKCDQETQLPLSFVPGFLEEIKKIAEINKPE